LATQLATPTRLNPKAQDVALLNESNPRHELWKYDHILGTLLLGRPGVKFSNKVAVKVLQVRLV